MDLGIAGRWALVCAASKGLGKGCAQALGVELLNVGSTARGRAGVHPAQRLARGALVLHQAPRHED